jgi:phosphoribosyl 1,2-cyclic phosphodiesterase
MHVQVLGSGSGGNALIVRAGELCLLVDAGLPIDELERRLETARIPLHRLDAIALTHGHLDHARSAGLLARKSGARVYCSTAMMSNASVRAAKAFHALAVGGTCAVHSRLGRDVVQLTSIVLPHDADPTVAFRVEHEGRVVAVCTDLGEPDAAVGAALSSAHVLLLEFNHDAGMLASGPYTPALKRRIAGPRGHLSNEQAAELLRCAAGPALHTLVLLHLSRVNNTPEHASGAARAVLGALALGHVALHVAEQDQVGPNLAV